ncbi:hypothetical protein C8R47DRAFT_69800 [Mycena vitilis]|nr:hypothetical protein C8R47DRAFT_69800 [Mycena vitilis]
MPAIVRAGGTVDNGSCIIMIRFRVQRCVLSFGLARRARAAGVGLSTDHHSSMRYNADSRALVEAQKIGTGQGVMAVMSWLVLSAEEYGPWVTGPRLGAVAVDRNTSRPDVPGIVVYIKTACRLPTLLLANLPQEEKTRHVFLVDPSPSISFNAALSLPRQGPGASVRAAARFDIAPCNSPLHDPHFTGCLDDDGDRDIEWAG